VLRRDWHASDNDLFFNFSASLSVFDAYIERVAGPSAETNIESAFVSTNRLVEPRPKRVGCHVLRSPSKCQESVFSHVVRCGL